MNEALPAQAPDPTEESAAFYRTLYECNPQALLVFALESRQVLAANPSLLRLLAAGSPTPLIGQPVELLFGPEHASRLHAALSAMIPGSAATTPGKPCQLHWGERVIELRLAWPPIEIFAQTACILSLDDVSAEAHFNEAQTGQQSKLESLLEERTAALQTALHELETAKHAKRSFLSDMSHELRTPLNAILGFSRLLERDPAMSAEHRHKLGVIHHAGENLLALINEVLDTSRDIPQTAQQTASPEFLNKLVGENTAPPLLLVVDDQADNRWLARHLLESAGFTVATAENGEEAIAAVLARCPDLIWMDMRMPVLDGYEATRRIRALPGGQQIPIIAMTAGVMPEERTAMLAAGCNGVIGKPLDEAEVFSTLAQWLSTRADPIEAACPEAANSSALPSRPLPEHHRIPLMQAAERLDLDACREIASTMQTEAPEAAAQLLSLLERFRFDQIGLWCQQA